MAEAPSRITRLLLDQGVAETRAVAVAGDQPVGLFTDSPLRGDAPRLHKILQARFRARAGDGPGAFFETEDGTELYAAQAPAKSVAVGALLDMMVVSEARSGKLARVRTVSKLPEKTRPPLAHWISGLPGASDLSFVTDAGVQSEIDAAFDLALQSQVTLSGGGHLHIHRTPALTAVDIDTSGRRSTGQASARARSINLAAARETAYQFALRNIGGLGVIDCIAPLPRALGADVKAAFLDAFRAINPRKAAALAPSPFGLLEVKLDWGTTPIDELYLTQSGEPTPYAQCVSGLRALETVLQNDRGGRLVLELPKDAYMLCKRTTPDLLSQLHTLYGARCDIQATEQNQHKVITE